MPITNIPAADVQLRPEFMAVFKHANVEAEHLITLDDLPALSDIQHRLAPENTRWILVDHNALQGRLGKIYSERVGGVIDHHDEEGKVPRDTGDEPRIVQKTGSCSSLVTNYCASAWDALPASDKGALVKQWDAEVAQVALAGIVLDTANLRDENKTAEHDRAAGEYLKAKIAGCPELATEFDCTSFYNEINTAKMDIGALKLQDILRKDYKQWDQGGMKLGISSVVKPIEFLQAKAQDEAKGKASDVALLDALETFSQARELDLYSLMTTSTSLSGEFQRELLVWAFNGRGVAAAKAFAAASGEELGLADWGGPRNVASGGDDSEDGQWRRVWWQRQARHSRKRVGPLLREAMA